MPHPIRIGVGGWTYEPWRDTFYPSGLRQADELAFAARALTAIEVNGTYYGTQKPATFAKWAKETPDGFVFALKAPRFATSRRVLAEAGDSIARFLASGLTELGPKLGPINWQLPPTKKFDPDDMAAFLDLLPDRLKGLPLTHAIEARHDSFACDEFTTLLRDRGIAAIQAEDSDYPGSTPPPRPSPICASWARARVSRPAIPRPGSTAGPTACVTWRGRGTCSCSSSPATRRSTPRRHRR